MIKEKLYIQTETITPTVTKVPRNNVMRFGNLNGKLQVTFNPKVHPSTSMGLLNSNNNTKELRMQNWINLKLARKTAHVNRKRISENATTSCNITN